MKKTAQELIAITCSIAEVVAFATEGLDDEDAAATGAIMAFALLAELTVDELTHAAELIKSEESGLDLIRNARATLDEWLAL